MARILNTEDNETELESLRPILSKTPHDLAILDVIMPGRNGQQVCRSLKKNKEIKRTPIVLLTSKAEKRGQFRDLKPCADAYIAKPCDPGLLLKAIAKQPGEAR